MTAMRHLVLSQPCLLVLKASLDGKEERGKGQLQGWESKEHWLENAVSL